MIRYLRIEYPLASFMTIHAGKKLMTFAQRGGWWVVGQFLLLFLILWIPDPFVSWKMLFSLVSFHFIGMVLTLVSALILLSGVKSLWKALSPYPYPIENAPLIREGLYRFIRHPLYAGVMLGSIGVAVLRMNALSLIFCGILFYVLNAKANYEEAWLSEKFSEYESYRQKTKKFIPFLY